MHRTLRLITASVLALPLGLVLTIAAPTPARADDGGTDGGSTTPDAGPAMTHFPASCGNFDIEGGLACKIITPSANCEKSCGPVMTVTSCTNVCTATYTQTCTSTCGTSCVQQCDPAKLDC